MLSRSDWLLCDFTNHQRLWCLLFPLVRTGIQVSVHLGAGPTSIERYWRIVLPKSHHARIRWHLYPRGLSLRPVLPCKERERQSVRSASSDFDDHPDRGNCEWSRAAGEDGSSKAAVHYIIIVSYKPLIHSLPLSLAHLSYGMPKETGHEGSVIGENSEDHEPVNSSTEHLNKPQNLISAPDSMQEPQVAPAGGQGDGEYPPEKQVYESRKDVNPVSIDNGEAGVARDFAFVEKARDDPHYPPSGNGLPTSAGPPVGEPHVESMEMGIIGQEPDPSNEEDEEPYFALPGGPGVVRLHEQDENDPNAFFHPATKEPMRVIWLPRDELGLCEAEIEDNAKYGIPSVHRYATLNAKVGWVGCVGLSCWLTSRGGCRFRDRHRMIFNLSHKVVICEKGRYLCSIIPRGSI